MTRSYRIIFVGLATVLAIRAFELAESWSELFRIGAKFVGWLLVAFGVLRVLSSMVHERHSNDSRKDSSSGSALAGSCPSSMKR